MIQLLEGVFGLTVFVAALIQASGQREDLTQLQHYLTAGMGAGSVWLMLSVGLSLAPVIKDASAVVTNDGPGVIHVRMTATKVRDCQWVRTYSYVRDPDGIRQETTLSWENDRNRGNSKPVGRHRWEPARIEYDVELPASSVEVYAVHSCRWLPHDVTTLVGTWPIPARRP